MTLVSNQISLISKHIQKTWIRDIIPGQHGLYLHFHWCMKPLVGLKSNSFQSIEKKVFFPNIQKAPLINCVYTEIAKQMYYIPSARGVVYFTQCHGLGVNPTWVPATTATSYNVFESTPVKHSSFSTYKIVIVHFLRGNIAMTIEIRIYLDPLWVTRKTWIQFTHCWLSKFFIIILPHRKYGSLIYISLVSCKVNLEYASNRPFLDINAT